MLNFKTASALLFLVGTTVPLQAQVESDFYTPKPVVENRQLQVDASDYEGDDTLALQALIDEATNLSSNGGLNRGANIFIPAGRYYFSTITMRSNVHLKVKPDTTFRLISSSSPTSINKMFVFGADGQTHVTNASIVCQTSTDERFHITLTDTSNPWIMPISFGNASNFKLSGFRIIDKRSRFQGINFSTAINPLGHYVRPRDGIIKNVSIIDAAYGYGLVQMHSGENIFFKNISGIGGTTLRLESGFRELEAPNVVMEDIFARNVRCTNGNSAVMLSPHRQHHKTVDIRNVTGDNCGFAVRVSDSFGSDVPASEYGSFASDSIIRKVKVTLGDDARVKGPHLTLQQGLQHFRYAPCDFRDDYNALVNLNVANHEPQGYIGPSISASLMTASFDINFDPNLHISSLTTDGRTRPNGGKYVSEAIHCSN